MFLEALLPRLGKGRDGHDYKPPRFSGKGTVGHGREHIPSSGKKGEAVVMLIALPPLEKGDGVAMAIHNLLLRRSPPSSGKEKEWSRS